MEGRIIKGIGGFYYVETPEKIYESKASGLFRLHDMTPTVGDYVEIELNTDGTAYIKGILPRKNIFIRPPVSNIDEVFIIMSVSHPEFNNWLVDRMILLSRFNGQNPNIIINKSDLDEEKSMKLKKEYEESGFNVLITSEKNHDSIEKLKEIIKAKSTLFMGPSGVGKSTLISLISGHDLETGRVSDKTSRGKHTTRHVELLHYDINSYIIDTPGFSSLSLDFVEDVNNLESLYYEFHNRNCRFNDCMHINEPNCGVKKAIEDEKIEHFRYDNYLSFHNEIKNRRQRWIFYHLQS